jgi:hypothetical protein
LAECGEIVNIAMYLPQFSRNSKVRPMPSRVETPQVSRKLKKIRDAGSKAFLEQDSHVSVDANQ